MRSREANKPEAAAADELVEICEALDMGDPALSAGQVRLEVGLALGRWAYGLHAKYADTAISEPVHRLDLQVREIRADTRACLAAGH